MGMGTPVVESSTATFQRNRFLQQQLRLHHCQCACHFSHERSAEVRFNKRLSIEINWNLLAEIRGYLFQREMIRAEIEEDIRNTLNSRK